MYKIVDRKILFSNKIDFDELEYIDCGANSRVYKIELEGKYYALKIFNEPQYWNLTNFEKKLEINISSFVSPVKISYLNKKFNGYVMKFCNGKNLHEQKLNINVNQFVEYANKLFSDTDKLSELRYIIQDESISNTIFDNGFKIIDIDFYDNEFNPLFKDINDIKNFNKRAITRLLVNIFILNFSDIDLLKENIEFEQLKNKCISGDLSFIEFINIILYDEKFKNVKMDDMSFSLKKKINN